MENNFNTFLPIASIKQLSALHCIVHIMLFTILKYSYKKGLKLFQGRYTTLWKQFRRDNPQRFISAPTYVGTTLVSYRNVSNTSELTAGR